MTMIEDHAALHSTRFSRRRLMKKAAVVAGASAGVLVLGNVSTASAATAQIGGNLYGLMWNGSVYPSRPTTLAAGLAQYVGPQQPTDWLSGDVWIKTVASTPVVVPPPPATSPTLTQSASGNGSGGTNTFSFKQKSVAGSTLMIMLNADAGSTYTLPAGWVPGGIMPAGAGNGQAIYLYPNAPASTTVTVTCSTTDFNAWLLAEFAMPAGTSALDWNAQYPNYPNWTSATSYEFSTAKTAAAANGLVLAQVSGTSVTAAGWHLIGDAANFTGLWRVAGTAPCVIDVQAASSTMFAIDVVSIKP